MKKVAAAILAFVAGTTIALAGQTDKRIARIVKSMTLEEKAMLLVGAWEEGGNANIISSAGRTHALERLGLGQTTMNDGATGLRMDTLRAGYPDERYYCTGFPVSTLMASTWNDDLVQRVGAAIASEMSHYGTDLLLAPSLNIHRNPLCGRNFEYYSEDPVLAGHTGAMMVRGLQSLGAGATVKHFAANSQQTARVHNDVRASQRALREIYLRNFEIAIKEGHPKAVMSSYNKINGTRACAKKALLTDILRKEWGWDGIVMTDWFFPEVTSELVGTGNDLLMGGCQAQVDDIINGVNDGAISISDVDLSVSRVLRYIMDTPSYKGHQPDYAPDLESNAALALEAAQEGIVLLKNEAEALPLKDNDLTAVFGVGSYLFYANGLGAADVNKPYTVNLLQGMREEGIAISEMLDSYYRAYFAGEEVQLRETNTKTWKNWFFGYKQPAEAHLRSFFIDKRAQECSKAIITIARNAGECLDRDIVEGDYYLTATEKELISQVCESFHAVGKPVIVVINSGGPMDVKHITANADAIVLAWQPGQEGGRALARILSGKANPSGRMPNTWAVNYEDIPSSMNFPTHYTFRWDDVKTPIPEGLAQIRNQGYTLYEENIWVGYRHFNTAKVPVSFPFGYGLSYTTFGWSDARIVKQNGKTVDLAITVTNTGSRPGKDVVELYVSAPASSDPDFRKPARELKAYAKTPLLQSGESATVTMSVPLEYLASFHEDSMKWITDAGTYLLCFGSSVEDIRATLEFKLAKTIATGPCTRL